MEKVSQTNQTGAQLEGGESAADLNALLNADARLQGQFDRLVTKALGTARGNWERELEAREAAAGAERRSALEGELQRREEALKKRELRAEAAARLAAHSLPQELLDCVDASDADALEESVTRLKRAFNASVEGALRARLAGAPPKDGGSEARQDAQLRRAMGLK